MADEYEKRKIFIYEGQSGFPCPYPGSFPEVHIEDLVSTPLDDEQSRDTKPAGGIWLRLKCFLLRRTAFLRKRKPEVLVKDA